LGWLTTNERKEQMCLLLREALRVGNVNISCNYFSLAAPPSQMLLQLKSEMTNFTVVTQASKGLFGKTKKTYTGKVGGLQDDLVIAFQLAMIGSQKFFQDAKYQRFRAD